MKGFIGIMLAVLMLGACVFGPLSGAFGDGASSRATGADVAVTTVLKVVPIFPKVGDNVTFNATLRNMGDENATNVTVTATANTTTGGPMDLGTFYLGHDNGAQNLTKAPASTPYYLIFYWNTSKTGLGVQDGRTYRVTVTAANKTDANATNNSAYIEFSFNPPDKKWPYAANLTVTPGEVIVGENVTINATLKNNGSLPAPAEPVFFYLDYNWTGPNQDIYNTTVDLLDYFDLGESYIEFEWNTSDWAIGNHTVTVLVPSTGSNLTSENVTVSPVPPPPGKPDLTILDLALNETLVMLGDLLNLSVTVRNVGNEVSVPTYVNITDMLTSFSTNFSIPAMAIDEENVFHTDLDSVELGLGFHNLQVWVDRPSVNLEWNETNNTKLAKFSIISRPDLEVSNLKFYMGSSWVQINDTFQGDMVKIGVTIKNLGLNSSLNGTKLAFYLDNKTTAIGEKALYAYPAGAEVGPTFDWNTSLVTVGEHKIIAVVDPADQNDELNETNNEASANFTVLEVIKPPDLTIESMSLSTTTLSVGDGVTINLVIRNIGDGPAEDIDLDATLETMAGVVLKAINHTVMPYIEAKALRYVNLNWNLSDNLAPNNYIVKVAIDAQGRIDEVREDNNVNTTTIKVVQKVTLKSDPMISTITLDPEKPTAGKKFVVTVNVLNRGNKDARDLLVTVYLDGKKVDSQTIGVLGKDNATKALRFNLTAKTGGKHYINVTLFEGSGGSYTAPTKTIDVKKPQESPFSSTNSVLLILAVILLIAIAVVLIMAGSKKPQDERDEEEEEEEEEGPAVEDEEVLVLGGGKKPKDEEEE